MPRKKNRQITSGKIHHLQSSSAVDMYVSTKKEIAKIIEVFPKVQEFLDNVNSLAALGEDYIPAIIESCEKYEIEPELVARVLPRPIVERIREEAIKLNFLPKVDTIDSTDFSD